MKKYYHGTILARAEQIFKDGFIRRTSKENRTYHDTEIGFVYLTPSKEKAIDFGYRAWMNIFSDSPKNHKPDPVIVVFEVDTTGLKILPDLDEQEDVKLERSYETAEESIGGVGTVRVKEDIEVQRVISIGHKPFIPTKMGKTNEYDDQILKEINWYFDTNKILPKVLKNE